MIGILNTNSGMQEISDKSTFSNFTESNKKTLLCHITFLCSTFTLNSIFSAMDGCIL